MAKDKSPEQIVDEVEAALASSHPCPYCGLWDGTHTVTCEYLKHKGNVDAGRASGKSNKAVKTDAPVLEESIEEDKGKDSEEKDEAKPSQAELLERMKPKK